MKIKCPNCNKIFEYQNKDIEKETNQLKQIVKRELEATYKEKMQKMKADHLEELKESQDKIDNLKKELEIEQRTKNRVSKIIGENLEQYCYNEFKKIQNIAYPLAVFEKDNTISNSSKTKGDFILRDYVEKDGKKVESFSIMFEMKSQGKTGNQKNEKFFKKLDQDRKEKECEFAVLVSELELDNDLYNSGIVMVSNPYKNMYVVRPSNFLTIINLIKTLSMKNENILLELNTYKERDIDLKNFKTIYENNRNIIQEKFKNAGKNFTEAVDEIDKQIISLQEIKNKLLTSANELTSGADTINTMEFDKMIKDNKSMQKLLNDKTK